MTKIFTAIGNACTDLVASVEGEFLTRYDIPKGLCRFITDFDLLTDIKSEMGPFQSIPGGAGANVAHVMASLSDQKQPIHFISKIAADPEGLSFKKHMEENGVVCHFPVPSSPTGSSQVLTFITPDSERTFLSFDDVAIGFSSADYDIALLDKTDFLYLDGYCLVSPSSREGFVKASNLVRKNGGHVTFNIGDGGYAITQKDAVDDILNACDSMICNITEADVMFGKYDDIHVLVTDLSKRFLFGAVTNGAQGAHVFYDGEIVHVPSVHMPPEKLVDTNGAGDHFSGGFIFGLMNGLSLEKSGRLGILCATDCISHAGARPLGGRGSLKHLADQAKNC